MIHICKGTCVLSLLWLPGPLQDLVGAVTSVSQDAAHTVFTGSFGCSQTSRRLSVRRSRAGKNPAVVKQVAGAQAVEMFPEEVVRSSRGQRPRGWVQMLLRVVMPRPPHSASFSGAGACQSLENNIVWKGCFSDSDPRLNTMSLKVLFTQ